MINGKSVLAIIPARGGSKGLPRKNILNLAGRPLVGWPINAAQNSKHVDKVIVSTDDEEIARISKDQGAEVPFIRPEELASDTATSISVIEHAIEYMKNEGYAYEYCVLLEPTSPLTEPCDIDSALNILESERERADSIVGVCRVEAAHPDFDVRINQNGLVEPYIKDGFSTIGRRQDIDDLYFFEGSLYISSVVALLEQRGFYHQRTLPYIVPRWKSMEIDEVMDLICIEAIIRNKDKMNP